MGYLLEEKRLYANKSFAKYPLNPKKTALIIVDMQYGFLEPGMEEECAYPGWDALMSAHQKLIKFFREHDIPIIWLRFTTTALTKSNLWLVIPEIYGPPGNCFAPGKHDSEIIKEIAPKPGEIVIEKHCFDGFFDTDLDTVLRSLNVEFTVFTGVATNYCVSTTLRSAFHHRFMPVMVTDACGTFNQEMQDAECTVIGMLFGRLMTSDEVITELAASKVTA